MSEYPGPARAFGWLSLAATPVFALMALLTAVQGDSPANLLCGAGASAGFLLGGMGPMYLLMSLFHAAPWLRLIAVRRERRPMA